MQEKDPNKKRDILEQILAKIRAGLEQLFSALSKKEDPHQLLLLIAELNRVFEERRAVAVATIGRNVQSLECEAAMDGTSQQYTLPRITITVVLDPGLPLAA